MHGPEAQSLFLGTRLAAPGFGASGAGASAKGARRRHPPVVELVGRAGVGKTTLLHALEQRDPGLRAGLRLPKHRHIPTVIGLLPTYVALHWPPRGLLWPEIKRVTYLQTLWRALGSESSSAYRAILLDEGPVYFHARILVYGGRRVTSPGFVRWWRRSIEAWATNLAYIIWLDAPDATLVERIHNREGSPRSGAMSGVAEPHRLAEYQTAYDRVIAEVRAAGGPPVVRMDTSRHSVAAIVDRLLTVGLLAE